MNRASRGFHKPPRREPNTAAGSSARVSGNQMLTKRVLDRCDFACTNLVSICLYNSWPKKGPLSITAGSESNAWEKWHCSDRRSALVDSLVGPSQLQ